MLKFRWINLTSEFLMKVKLIKKSEIQPGNRIFKRVMGKTYLIRRTDLSFEIIEYMCRHQLASLDLGELEGNIVTCSRHGWKYDIVTGKCVLGDGTSLKFCKFEEDEEWIYLILNSEGDEDNY